jgi:acyl-CoA dehydrogenase
MELSRRRLSPVREKGGLMRRTIFIEDPEAFRKTVRAFYAKSVGAEFSKWEADGHPPPEFWRQYGEWGLLGIQAPEEYGGPGRPASDST